MKTTRTLLSCFASLLVAASSQAQLPAAIVPANLILPQLQERYVSPLGLPRPVPQSVPRAVTMPEGTLFTVGETDTNWQAITAGSLDSGVVHSFTVTVHNTSSNPQSIYFRRYEQLPVGWSSSVCWGVNCYTAGDDSEAFLIAADSSAQLILDFTPAIYDAPDSGSVWLRVGPVGTSTDTVQLPFSGTFVPGNPPIIFTWSGTPTFRRTYVGPASGGSQWTLQNLLQNQSGRSVNYALSIVDSLPTGWSLAFHDTRQPSSPNNLMDTLVSGDRLVTNFAGEYLYDSAGNTSYQQKLAFKLTTLPTITREDSAVIYLSVHPETANPADSANYRFVMDVMPSAGVGTNVPDDRAGIAVTNAWPNPLVSEGILHLEILTDASGPAKAVVYDVTGTQKASIDLGTLAVGTNALQVAAPTLASGEYMFRIEQDGSASEVVKINLVK